MIYIPLLIWFSLSLFSSGQFTTCECTSESQTFYVGDLVNIAFIEDENKWPLILWGFTNYDNVGKKNLCQSYEISLEQLGDKKVSRSSYAAYFQLWGNPLHEIFIWRKNMGIQQEEILFDRECQNLRRSACLWRIEQQASSSIRDNAAVGAPSGLGDVRYEEKSHVIQMDFYSDFLIEHITDDGLVGVIQLIKSVRKVKKVFDLKLPPPEWEFLINTQGQWVIDRLPDSLITRVVAFDELQSTTREGQTPYFTAEYTFNDPLVMTLDPQKYDSYFAEESFETYLVYRDKQKYWHPIYNKKITWGYSLECEFKYVEGRKIFTHNTIKVPVREENFENLPTWDTDIIAFQTPLYKAIVQASSTKKIQLDNYSLPVPKNYHIKASKKKREEISIRDTNINVLKDLIGLLGSDFISPFLMSHRTTPLLSEDSGWGQEPNWVCPGTCPICVCCDPLKPEVCSVYPRQICGPACVCVEAADFEIQTNFGGMEEEEDVGGELQEENQGESNEENNEENAVMEISDLSSICMVCSLCLCCTGSDCTVAPFLPGRKCPIDCQCVDLSNW